MCGIAGIINLKGGLIKSDSLYAMTKSLRNRGPDDEGYILFDNKVTHYHGDDSITKNKIHIKKYKKIAFKVGFGFRQLKIIDLSNNSHQPMSDRYNRYFIIFNGEVYNYKEIRNELIGLGYVFRSQTDTEVVLYSYIQWRESALYRFNGMFAFSIFDTLKNEIFIARDRIGIKPLYYQKTDYNFTFSSTIKSILDSNISPPEINWEGLWQNYRFSIAQRPLTCFYNIEALEPSHFIKINLNTNNFLKKRYWHIPTNIQDFSITKEKAINIIEEELYNSIQLRLNADVEVGTFMSGGIDSTTITSIASLIKPNIKALTLGLKGYESYDEIESAKTTAKSLNVHHIIKNIDDKEVIKHINQMVIAYEEPYHNLSANYILAMIASENKLKVVLNGLGGDELFGGYDVFKKISLWHKLKRNKNYIHFLPKIHPKIIKGKQISKYNTIGEYYSHYYTTFTDIDNIRLFKNVNFNTKNVISNFYLENNSFTDDFEAISYLNLKSYIANHQMRAVDQSTMSFSLEGRFPFLDHNFIKASFSIPTKFKINNKGQKYIFKEFSKRYISYDSINMNKKGLGLPLENWINGNLKELVNDSILNLQNRNIFNNNEINNIVKANNHLKIWQLVTTELWLQAFIDK